MPLNKKAPDTLYGSDKVPNVDMVDQEKWGHKYNYIYFIIPLYVNELHI